MSLPPFWFVGRLLHVWDVEQDGDWCFHLEGGGEAEYTYSAATFRFWDTRAIDCPLTMTLSRGPSEKDKWGEGTNLCVY